MTIEFEEQIKELTNKYGQFSDRDIGQICVWMQDNGCQKLTLSESFEKMCEKIK